MSCRHTITTPELRFILKSSDGLGGALWVGGPWKPARAAAPMLPVASRVIEVNNTAAQAFSVLGSNGTHGFSALEGCRIPGGLLTASGDPLQTMDRLKL